MGDLRRSFRSSSRASLKERKMREGGGGGLPFLSTRILYI